MRRARERFETGLTGPEARYGRVWHHLGRAGDHLARMARPATSNRQILNPDQQLASGGTDVAVMAKRSNHPKRIAVDLSSQTLKAYEGADVMFSFDCVTGSKDHPTDPGHFRILHKSPNHVSQAYGVPMHWAMFFTTDGKAIHQYHGMVPLSVVRTLKEHVTDYLGSHGCVRLVESDAKALFEWADYATAVHVEGQLT
jgi:lipoprotein-anchoring transpeptidase ErfK/SrfK